MKRNRITPDEIAKRTICHADKGETEDSDVAADNESASEDESGDSEIEVQPLRKRLNFDSGDHEATSSHEKYIGRDGTVWKSEIITPNRSSNDGRKSKLKVLKEKCGPTKFIQLRSNDEKDVFLEF